MNRVTLTLNHLSKSFKNTVALKKLTLDFAGGQLHGIIGPEGAGKTTLARLMAGLLAPSSGEITFYINDDPVPFEKMRAQIAYMPERQSLYADLTIDEHLHFFSKLYGLTEEHFHKGRKRLLQITRLEKFADRKAGKLSGGMYKKLGLACALLRSPRVLLLDEPTNGVDPISRREFWDLLYDLQAENILTILTTAYMDEAERCAKTHILFSGELLCSGDPQGILKDHGAHNFNDFFINKAKEQCLT